MENRRNIKLPLEEQKSGKPEQPLSFLALPPLDKPNSCVPGQPFTIPSERLRLSKAQATRNDSPAHKINNTKWNPINATNWNPITNAKWNPINNAKRHNKAMTWKVKQALLHGHSPETIAWHAGNVTATLSSPEAQAALNMTGVVIHCFAFSHGGITIKNAGHYTTNHRFVVAATAGKPIKLSQYNSYVLLTLPLGEWSDDVSWRRAERAATSTRRLTSSSTISAASTQTAY